MNTETTQRATAPGIDVSTVMTVERKAFEPKPPLVLTGNPARKLNSRDRARLLKFINRTRAGKNHYVIEVEYDKITDAPERINGSDYQAPSAVSRKTHQGLLVRGEKSKSDRFYITVLDNMRTNKGEQGFTSMRLEGIRKIVSSIEFDGPLPPKP